MPILAGQLVQDQQLVSVAPGEGLTQALTLMIEHDFSQLPVVDPEGKPLGIITCASIAKAMLHLGAKVEELRVDHALVKISTHPAEEDLLYLLDTILKVSAVFVVDTTDKLIGIITEYDTTQYFRQRAEDLVLINDIEDALKRHLQVIYGAQGKESASLRDAIDGLSSSLDGIRKKSHASLKALTAKIKDAKPEQKVFDEIVDKYFPLRGEAKQFSDLTLSEFIQLAHKKWEELEPIFGIAQPSWTKMMDDIRDIRNKLFHFKGDTSAVERNKLQFCANWYTNHPPLPDKEAKIATPVEEPVVTETPIQGEVIMVKEDPEPRVVRIDLRNFSSEKYKPVADLLKAHESTPVGNEVKINIAWLNNAIAGGLATAAREQASWWNRAGAYSREWIKMGWQATSVDSQWLNFKRQRLPDKNKPIDFANDWYVAYWCAVFECSEERLKDAYDAAGPLPVDMEKQLAKRKARIKFIQPKFD